MQIMAFGLFVLCMAIAIINICYVLRKKDLLNLYILVKTAVIIYIGLVYLFMGFNLFGFNYPVIVNDFLRPTLLSFIVFMFGDSILRWSKYDK